MSGNTLWRVEQACTDLLDIGEQVTFTAVAARTGLRRATPTVISAFAPSSTNTEPVKPKRAPWKPSPSLRARGQRVHGDGCGNGNGLLRKGP
jgi:hypothetical protein